jgi:hypothetical protein
MYSMFPSSIWRRRKRLSLNKVGHRVIGFWPTRLHFLWKGVERLDFLREKRWPRNVNGVLSMKERVGSKVVVRKERKWRERVCSVREWNVGVWINKTKVGFNFDLLTLSLSVFVGTKLGFFLLLLSLFFKFLFSFF